MRIVVSGASGLIGQALVPALAGAGHEVVRLVRRAPQGPGEVAWAPERGELDAAALGAVDAAVHLAGENVGDGRWTDARKRQILGSRVDGTRTLVAALTSASPRPKTLVSASAVGFYGDRGDALLGEDAGPGSDFLAEVCKAWEAETRPAEDAGLRVVRARLGVVLAGDGGALARMLTPFKLGLGGKIGGGRQWLSWVTKADAVRALVRAVEDPALAGAVNVTAPEPVTQAELAATLGRVLRRPAFMPLPGFAVKAMFGEMGASVLLAGQRALPRRLLAAGFTFTDPALEPALRRMLRG